MQWEIEEDEMNEVELMVKISLNTEKRCIDVDNKSKFDHRIICNIDRFQDTTNAYSY